MIKNIVFMLLGGLVATAVLTIIAMWQATDDSEKDYTEHPDECDGNR